VEAFILFLVRFLYTIGVVFILARFMYYPRGGRKDFLLTYLLVAAIISQLCIMINRVEMSFGFALGIFAIFSLIRYRTTSIQPRELTYIFLSVGIAAKNHLVPEDFEFYRIVFSDVLLLGLTGLLEYFLFRKKESTKIIVYNNLDLIHPDKRPDLLADLNKKFGIANVKALKTGKIDIPKNTVRLQVIFEDKNDSSFDDD
jgi:hypothetical protein